MSETQIELVEDDEQNWQDFRPTQFFFLGRAIKVLYIDEGPWGSDVYGDFYPKEQRIRILEGLTPVEEMDTFLHECLHMIMYYMRVMMGQVDEEMIVHRLATGLSSMLVENPHVAQYLNILTQISLNEIAPEETKDEDC